MRVIVHLSENIDYVPAKMVEYEADEWELTPQGGLLILSKNPTTLVAEFTPQSWSYVEMIHDQGTTEA